MATFGMNIRSLYFQYQPITPHADECSRAGTDLWEVTQYTWENLSGEVQETTVRFVCGECGRAAFQSTDGPLPGIERTHVSRIGFGSKPERVAGMWLHPGPLLLPGDGHGPNEFYVTRTAARPKAPSDVTGAVGWTFGKRGGVHWRAGLGLTDYGNIATSADQTFGSKRAAVAWISAQSAGGVR